MGIERDHGQENDPDLERRDRDHVIERSVQDRVIVRSDLDHAIENEDHAQKKEPSDLEN